MRREGFTTGVNDFVAKLPLDLSVRYYVDDGSWRMPTFVFAATQ